MVTPEEKLTGAGGWAKIPSLMALCLKAPRLWRLLIMFALYQHSRSLFLSFTSFTSIISQAS